MGIRILSENEIKPAASSFHAPSLLYANPKNLYQRRAKRLRELAENNAFRDYLLFAADIVDIQLELLETQPIKDISLSLDMLLEKGNSPLNAKQFQRSDEWRVLLLQLITRYRCKAKDEVLPTLEWLEKASQSELESLADHLCNERYEEVSADKAVFIWAALSLYWVQLAQQLPRQTQSDVGGRQTCPVCDSSPVTSVVHFGDTQGLRYLHCALCESEWNMVRAKCSNCEQSGKLDYWSLDSHDAAVKAESCGDCGSYLKILSQEKDPQVEPVADDLATLFLDVEMEEKNLHRTGLNPFMFVGN